MSRSGYIDGWDMDSEWAMICWRGAVMSAIRGRRGQAFLKEMLAALDALPEKRLIAHDLEKDGEVCAIGSVGKARGIDMKAIDPEEYLQVADAFGIAQALAREIEYENDEMGRPLDYRLQETPEHRYERMRKWVERNIIADPPIEA